MEKFAADLFRQPVFRRCRTPFGCEVQVRAEMGLHDLLGALQAAYVMCARDALKIKGQIITVNNDEGAVRLGAAGEDGSLLFAERIEHEGNHVLVRRLPFDCFPGDYYFQPKAFTEKRFGLT